MPLHDPAHAFVPYPDAPLPHAPSGPLAGLSFAVKDLFDVAGYPTGGGNPIVLALSGIKTQTAPTVQRLLDAGARFVGKTVTDELAFSMNGNNAHFGAPINGAAPARISGGSSSGSASAVSNGLCEFALGTDTGGSVRAPASHCGLYGLRPTHGRISLQGALDLAPSCDTCGFFARDSHCFAQVAEQLLGTDSAPLPALPRLLLPSEVWAPLGPGVAERFAWSRQVSDAQVSAAREFRSRFRAHLAALLGHDGVLLMPTMPDIAPLRSAPESTLEDYRNKAINMLCIAGLSGFPQLSLPLLQRDGAPLGLSLLGPAGSDASLVALAQRLAQAGLGR